ncbi:Rpa49 subunit specific to nuclear RNA polymerase I [Suillus subalutaceus]|uniref:Rpa49 subunit specific to nuclear RNA polymerase I n=1 Tax=Suillus subalutaceus TaxID=48586 RepID=UPI001B87187D|nr:Rpa49 subunit specific to nuclear RNA polymerase I [Suillus subalutaceus]KAG1838570.1 Rpa49 subunit specific to nuclear RNA polymerase I [Suillus subalutaceus]
MAAMTTSKKRKRELDDTQRVSFALSDQPATQLGPVLANFPSVKPTKSTSFKCYKTQTQKPTTDNEEMPFVEIPMLIAGETEAVDFYSSEETRRGSLGSRYLVGVHNKRTGITTLRAAPLHILTHEVKALKGLQPAAVSTLQRLEARAALGETFGTKKAKLAIRAQERNKVDVSAMEGVADHLQESILKNTSTLPSKEEAKANADSTRLVPQYDIDALNPNDIYPLHNMIPKPEWKALSISNYMSADGDAKRVALLPFKRSHWVNDHLALAFASPSPDKTTIKMLIYISTMIAFHKATFKNINKDVIQEKLPMVPSVVIDGLLSRFSETARGSVDVLAADLSMEPAKVNMLFKSLGCKINKLTQSDLKRLGLPDSAVDVKRAILKTPLEFPKPRIRRRT